MSISYKDSGVDKEEGYKVVDLIKQGVKKTHNASVINNIGSFASLYELGNYKNPVLVSGTDGVGTKLEVAFTNKVYNTVGIDAVAMCVNDILCHGAKPLFFLDYLACGQLDAQVANEIVSGVIEGCVQATAALVGGETAEMPGFYKPGDYDIAGFCCGVVEKEQIIDGKQTQAGDVLIALPSSGAHSNGFSLIRKLFANKMNDDFDGKPLWQELLTPTKIYVQPVLKLLESCSVQGIAHITGGGLFENLPRAYKQGLRAVVEKDLVKILPIFKLIQESANITDTEMFSTFNMGVGLVLIVKAEAKEQVLAKLEDLGEPAYCIGYLEEAEEKELCLK